LLAPLSVRAVDRDGDGDGSAGFAKRRQITPLVRFVERVFVVFGVARLDFG
jgi:hypothetical protein